MQRAGRAWVRRSRRHLCLTAMYDYVLPCVIPEASVGDINSLESHTCASWRQCGHVACLHAVLLCAGSRRSRVQAIVGSRQRPHCAWAAHVRASQCASWKHLNTHHLSVCVREVHAIMPARAVLAQSVKSTAWANCSPQMPGTLPCQAHAHVDLGGGSTALRSVHVVRGLVSAGQRSQLRRTSCRASTLLTKTS